MQSALTRYGIVKRTAAVTAFFGEFYIYFSMTYYNLCMQYTAELFLYPFSLSKNYNYVFCSYAPNVEESSHWLVLPSSLFRLSVTLSCNWWRRNLVETAKLPLRRWPMKSALTSTMPTKRRVGENTRPPGSSNVLPALLICCFRAPSHSWKMKKARKWLM